MAAEVDGEKLTEVEFDSFFLLLAVAGNETTRNLISGGMLALMQHPDERRRLLADPSLMPTAVEEMLRWVSPVMYFRRTATRDAELRGQPIREGDKLTVWYGSANRDEDVFPHADRFDVGRTPNEHLAFGIGHHFCLGANLARLEIQIMFEELLRRVPKLPAGESPHEGLLAWTHAGARSQVEVALAHPIRLLVNALGTPPRDVIDQVHARGVQVAALCGGVEHARRHVEAGVDIIVAQGSEAGGHTGEIGTMVLIPDVVDAVAPTPVLAAGGIGCGRQIAAALALGAEGAWMGSVWLATTESDLHPVAMKKVLQATARDTVRSRSMTGKPARQLRTRWTEAWDDPSSPGALPMPLQFLLTADATTRIHRYAHLETSGAKELVGTPVGQIVGRMSRVRPVRGR